MFNKFCD